MRFEVVVCWVEALSGRREYYSSGDTAVGLRVPERTNSAGRSGIRTRCVGTGSPASTMKQNRVQVCSTYAEYRHQEITKSTTTKPVLINTCTCIF